MFLDQATGVWSRTSCGIAKRRRHSASTLSGKRFVNSMPWPIQLFALNDISFCVPALVARGVLFSEASLRCRARVAKVGGKVRREIPQCAIAVCMYEDKFYCSQFYTVRGHYRLTIALRYCPLAGTQAMWPPATLAQASRSIGSN